ncbi:MAG: hypothetical protein M1433_00185 [Candidatus Parvarchaeota archaeon]|nr:hypothetical protein [Candidatus Parvarchaeota archaeon]
MEMLISDSKILGHIIEESLIKSIGEDGAEKALYFLRLREANSSDLIRTLNEVLVKAGYTTKLKNVFERLGDNLSSRVDVKINPEEVSLGKNVSEYINIEVTNRFDVPLIFEVNIEDRDSFLPIVYNKIDGAYFNSFSQEKIIDSGAMDKFKFKVGLDSGVNTKSTTLFVVVRSKDIEGLNWIGKVKVSFSK